MNTTNNKREVKSAMKSNAKAAKRMEDAKKDDESALSGSYVEAQMSPVTKTNAQVSSQQEEEQIPSGMMHPLPKRATTSYFFFCQDNHAKLRESRYDGKSENGQQNIVDIARELGNRWNLLGDDDKKVYTEMYEKDKLRHQSQLQEIKDKGYFVMDDGKKSNQVLVPVPSRIANKKVVTKTRGTQTGKEYLNEHITKQADLKVEKLRRQIEKQVKEEVREKLLAKRANLQRSKSATQIVKSEKVAQSQSAVKEQVSRKKPAGNSKTPQKSQSTKNAASQSQQVAKFGSKSRSRSKTPRKEQQKSKVMVKDEKLPTNLQKKRSGKSLTNASQKADASKQSVKVVQRAKQTQKRQKQHNALAEAQ